MKKMIRIVPVFCLLAFFFISGTASAQTAATKAKFDGNMVISVDPSAALVKDYEVDFSGMAFKDEDAAKTFFRSMTDNLVNCDVNYETKIATLHLHTQYQPDWTVSEWNAYLAKNAERYRTSYTRANAN